MARLSEFHRLIGNYLELHGDKDVIGVGTYCGSEYDYSLRLCDVHEGSPGTNLFTGRDTLNIPKQKGGAKVTAYEKYQLRWMIDHGYSLAKLMEELTEYQKLGDPADPVSDIFHDWAMESGFDSEIWSCEKEWRDCDGKPGELDEGRLAVAEKLCKKCGYVPEDIGCEVLQDCGFSVNRYMTGGLTVRDAQNEILYHYSN